jgi:hypothetical protein
MGYKCRQSSRTAAGCWLHSSTAQRIRPPHQLSQGGARRAEAGVEGQLAVRQSPTGHQLSKTLAAIDLLSGGRLVAGVGPGSSAADYAAAGIEFQERWPRFEEAVQMLRVLLQGDAAGFEGQFYFTRGVVLEPRPRAAARATDLGRELGLASGASADGPPGPRMARLRLQHHSGPVPRGPGPARRGTTAHRQGAGDVPERDRHHHLASRHRGQGRRRAGSRRGAGADAAPPGRRSSARPRC